MQNPQDQVNPATASIVPNSRFSENQRRFSAILTGGRIPDPAKAGEAYLSSPRGQALIQAMDRMASLTSIHEEIAFLEEALAYVTKEIRLRRMH